MPSNSRTSDQMRGLIAENTEARSDGCLIWTGPITNMGYGRAYWTRPGQRKIQGAHRVAYTLFKGEIPEGLSIDHLCRTRLCVNPDHMEAVSQRENTLRSPIAIGALNAAKTHCPHGHPYDQENTYVWRHTSRSTTVRVCKACVRDRRRRASQRAETGGVSPAMARLLVVYAARLVLGAAIALVFVHVIAMSR